MGGIEHAARGISGVLGEAQAEARPGERVELILDQSRASERHQILMLALRWGERALPLAWRVEETLGSIGFAVQQQLLDTVAAWLPEAARVLILVCSVWLGVRVSRGVCGVSLGVWVGVVVLLGLCWCGSVYMFLFF